MDSNKILEVIEIYSEYFTKEEIEYVDFSHIDKPEANKEMLAHCHGMLHKIKEFIQEDRIEKAFRWLGFVQGCLWSTGCYSLEDLMNHNRPNI